MEDEEGYSLEVEACQSDFQNHRRRSAAVVQASSEIRQVGCSKLHSLVASRHDLEARTKEQRGIVNYSSVHY